MSENITEIMIRRAIGGDAGAISWVATQVVTTGEAQVVVMAATLERRPELLDRALALASTSRDRQLVAIAAACLAGDTDLLGALARDHLSDHPGSLIAAWIASGPLDRTA